MKKTGSIDSVVVLDDEQGRLREFISAQRPDLDVYGDQVDQNVLIDRRYAVITFNPGSRINDFDGANWVHCSGAGVDSLLDALNFTVPLITRTVGRMGDQIAEYVLAYLLCFEQRLALRSRLQSEKKWDRHAASPRYLRGSRALIFGTGAIGCVVAQRLTAMGVHCVGVSRSGTASESFQQAIPISAIKSLALDRFQYVIIVLPCLPATRSLIDSSILARLSHSILINVGRAQTLVIDDLLTALDSGSVERAVLDVFEQEPLPDNSPLWSHPKITVTPHVSGLSQLEDVAAAFLAALNQQEAGLQPEWVVSQTVGY